MKQEQTMFFLNIDTQSVYVLCNAIIQKYQIEWINQEKKIIIKGKNALIAAQEIAALFGKNVVLGEDLGLAALQRLGALHRSISTAESCTGGLLAYCFTKNAGASEVFMGGIISYANAIKEKNLNVSTHKLESFGAVSEEVVGDMLKGALYKFQTDIALATSGIAGPSGGSETKPVGTVVIGMQAIGNPPIIERHLFSGNRIEIQEQSCFRALEILLKNL